MCNLCLKYGHAKKKSARKKRMYAKDVLGVATVRSSVIVTNLNAFTARVTTQQEARTVRNIRLNSNY